MPVEYYRFLDIGVHAATMEDLHKAIVDAVSQQGQVIIAHHNLHSVALCQRNERMRDFYSAASLVHVDGMSLVFIGRLLGRPLNRSHRVTYVDWIRPLMQLISTHNYRVFYLGSKPDIGVQAAEKLVEAFPNLTISVHHGYFDAQTGSAENEEILDQISKVKPHVLMVGMGMPRQEMWILDNLGRLNVPVVLPCGACMDYVAGVVPTPPRWMGRMGLEWLYRLVTEPRRLWRRYLVEPWGILWLFTKDLISRS